METYMQQRFNELMTRSVSDLITYVIDLEDEIDGALDEPDTVDKCTKCDDYSVRVSDLKADLASLRRLNSNALLKIEKLEGMLKSVKKIVTDADDVTTSLPNTDVNPPWLDHKDDYDKNTYDAGWDDGFCDARGKVGFSISTKRSKQYAAGYSDGYDIGGSGRPGGYNVSSSLVNED